MPLVSNVSVAATSGRRLGLPVIHGLAVSLRKSSTVLSVTVSDTAQPRLSPRSQLFRSERRWHFFTKSAARLSSTVPGTHGDSSSANAIETNKPSAVPSEGGLGAGSALQEATVSGALAHPPTSAYEISYKGPIEEDTEGGARHASAVAQFWGNVPNHVRASFQAHNNTDDAPRPAAPLLFDGFLSKAKELVATTGFAPADWASASDAAAQYYGGQIPLAPYKKGQTAAYNYPRVLVQRELAHRFPIDMYVDPVYQTSNVADRPKMNSATLFPRLQGKTTMLIVFSGQPLSGLWTGVRHWLNTIGEEFEQLPNTQVFKLHAEEGWFNRRTHALTKFHLRRQLDDSEQFKTFVYRGKWKAEYARTLHMYNKELPVVLLVDPLGYVRWHAVGQPSDDATAVFRNLAPRLAREKRNFI
eukprot:TRINITY_DN70370_c0_g1_i1.p1 TRINITY_DN70370_c0_g1~~TRINITY_DN70370_c0_g1_i1.p1  ORF type:complete len:415 (-),score=53.26 TRINITY_DN70370_c0_g1_i1:67-1311(-)